MSHIAGILVWCVLALLGFAAFATWGYQVIHAMYMFFVRRHDHRIASMGHRARATLIAVRTSWLNGSNTMTRLVNLTYRRTMPDGTVRERTFMLRVDPADPPRVGDVYDIFYDPQNPEDWVLQR